MQGHWLTLRREKRKEHNQVAGPLLDVLHQERAYLEAVDLDDFVAITIIEPERHELEKYGRCLPWYRRRGFRAAMTEYLDLKSEAWDGGDDQSYFAEAKAALHMNKMVLGKISLK